MVMLVFLAGLAAILGFSAHRASICTVRAGAELLHSRRGFMLASIIKSVLWISAVTIPFFVVSKTSPLPGGDPRDGDHWDGTKPLLRWVANVSPGD